MIREVELVSYLPEFMKQYKEPVEALKAENKEFLVVWDAVNRILYNHFISTADEYGISRFEKLLKIYPDVTDTLEARRKRVLSRWFQQLPYTLQTLINNLIQLLGGEHHFSISGDFENTYQLIVTMYSLDESSKTELDYLLATILPLNIATQVIYESALVGTIFHGSIMTETIILEIKQK